MEKELNLEATLNLWPYIGASLLIFVFKGLGFFTLPWVWVFSPIAAAFVVIIGKLIFSAFKK